MYGHEKVVKLLLEHGVDPNYKGFAHVHSSSTALLLASYKGNEAVVKLLL